KSLRDGFHGICQPLLAAPESDLRFLGPGDVAPRADHFHRLTVAVANQVLLVDHPAVGAVLLEKPILDGVTALLVQLDGFGLDRRELVGVDPAAPEIRIFQVFLRLVAEPVLDVLADESRCEISRGLVAVDHRRRAGQQVHETLLRGDERFAELLARSYVAPCPDRLDRIPDRITDHLQLVADPAVAPVLLAEAVLIAEAVLFEQARVGFKNAWAVLGVDATFPEIRAVEVFLTIVPK